MRKYGFAQSCLTGISSRLTANCVRVLQILLVLTPMLLAPQGRAFAQAQNTGSIFGTVTDPSGAVIPNATVTAAEPSKGVNRAIQSSKTGEFLLSDLPVGTYILTVTATGFETTVTSDITIDADKSVKLSPKLTVGSAKDTVTVNGEGTALDTRSSTIGTLIDTKLVESLPIDGNNVVALAGLLPGVTDLNAPATSTSDRGGPTFSVSGSRNTQNLMLFDGLMWNNLFYNTGINYPPPNALQEISVLLNNFKAQYGRNAGSVFNVVTKSGSNQIHGAVWDYLQSRIFNASDYITKENPTDNSNQAGFDIGGPIIKDKAFFFLSFQDLIQHLQVIGVTPVQAPAERGLLAVCADGSIDTYGCAGGAPPASVSPLPCTAGVYAAGTTCASYVTEVLTNTPSNKATNAVPGYSRLLNPETITGGSGYNPQPANATENFQSAWYQAGNTGTNPCIDLLAQAASYASSKPYLDGTTQGANLPNAEIPTACLNPVISNILAKYVPFPNIGPNGGVASSTNPHGYIPGNISKGPQPRHDINLLARVDYHFARHTLDARYDLIKANDATAPGVNNTTSVGIATYALDANNATSNFGNIGDTWILTPNILNVFRAGYKRYVLVSPPIDSSTLNTYGGNFVEPGFPTLPVLNASGFYQLGATTQAYDNTVNENIEILDQISWSHGNHSFQFGANFLRLQYLNNQQYPGTLSFSTNYTAISMADEAIGGLNSVQANSPLVQGGVSHSIFTYAQDDWRATPKLTFNLGIRYELPFQWFQPAGYASTFIPGHQSTVFPGAVGGLAFPGDKGVLRSLVPTDFNGLVPRFGFAYDALGSGRLVLRGGFGMFFDAINANVIGVGEPFYYQAFHALPPGGASVPLATFGNNPSDTSPNGNVAVIPGGYNKANPQFSAPYSLFFPDRNFRTPYYEAMNLGFQLRVTRGGVLDTNFVGKLGRKLTIPFDQNPAIMDCTGGYYQSNPGLYAAPDCPYLFPGSTAGNASSTAASTQARLRYTPFNYGGGGLVDFASIGTSNYNGLQVQFTQRGGNFLTILASYTYSKSIDLQTQSETTTNSIPNVFNVSSERGLSDYDARQVLNLGWVVNFPKVQTESSIVNAVINNWLYGGTFFAHTGRPYNVTINGDVALDGEPDQRAALMPGISPNLPKNRHRQDKVKEWFNINAFTYPTLGTLSNVPRNAFEGPGYLVTNMNLGRYFSLAPIHEGMRLLFRADAFNVWNTPNLGQPKAGYSCGTTSIDLPGNANYGLACNSPTVGQSLNSTFGTIPNTYGNNGNVSTNGRKMQFSATIYF
jgi:hypothetical protein